MTAASNKGMKQTKPAQAMELRSLSPVLDLYSRGETWQLIVRLRKSRPTG
jgi:hypothetical protein